MLQLSFDESTQSALVSEGLLTPEQLSNARDLAAQLGAANICEILLDLNLVSKTRLDDFVRRHRNTVSVGDILLSRNLVSEHDVKAAREIQLKSAPKSKRIGETLIEMGLIEERH